MQCCRQPPFLPGTPSARPKENHGAVPGRSQVGETAEAVPGIVRAGRPRSREAIIVRAGRPRSREAVIKIAGRPRSQGDTFWALRVVQAGPTVFRSIRVYSCPFVSIRGSSSLTISRFSSNEPHGAGGNSLARERGRPRPHAVPVAAAELQCDAAGSHPAGGNRSGRAEGEPWRRSRLIQVEEMVKAVPGLGAGGTPALPGSHHCAGGTPALPGSHHHAGGTPALPAGSLLGAPGG